MSRAVRSRVDTVAPEKGWPRPPSGPASLQAALTLALAIALIALVLFRQSDLLNYRLWEDEAETIVAGRMMAAGGRLYDDVFNLHGPLVFLPTWVLALVAKPGIIGYRWLIVGLQWVCLIALASAPIPTANRMMRDFEIRLVLSLAAAVVMVTTLPWVLGHTFQYQTIAGVITFCILASSVMPAITGAPPPAVGAAVLIGMLLACLPFLAVTYGPATMLLLFAGLHRDRLKATMLGGALGVAGNLAFLLWKGSLAGYLAYHLYLNLRILPAFMPRHPALAFIDGMLSPAGLPRWQIRRDLTELLWVLGPCVLFWVLATRAVGRRWPSWRATLALLALGSFLIRGSGFQATPFWYGILTIPLLALRPAGIQMRQRPWLLPASAGACLVVLATCIVAQRPLLAARRIPPSSEFAQLARRLTGPNDRIIAYAFSNYQYIIADRLPASGYFFYLPLQAAYNAAPVLDIRIDPCAEIRASRPKLMLITGLRLYGFPSDHYDGCLGAIVRDDYTRIDDKPYYIRNDLAPSLSAPRP